MKIVIKEDKFIIYLNKLYLKSTALSSKSITEKYLKELLSKLENKYNLELLGYYDANIYVDKIYGVIIEVTKHHDYFDYFDSQFEIDINVIESEFLYEIYNITNTKQLYSYNSKLYIKLIEPITSINLGKIIENTKEIIYGVKAKNILKKAKKVIV